MACGNVISALLGAGEPLLNKQRGMTDSLAHTLLRHQISLRLARNSPHFMEIDSSLAYLIFVRVAM
jgi:hypothetical protein